MDIKRPSEITDEDRILAVVEVAHYGTDGSIGKRLTYKGLIQ